jgi:hypothetical protein
MGTNFDVRPLIDALLAFGREEADECQLIVPPDAVVVVVVDTANAAIALTVKHPDGRTESFGERKLDEKLGRLVGQCLECGLAGLEDRRKALDAFALAASGQAGFALLMPIDAGPLRVACQLVALADPLSQVPLFVLGIDEFAGLTTTH